ncbi:MAG: hypothetical protein C5B52_04460 [Bacteroidetes bacterium]|nr:MAG: hypothetical protein C5B52_04460 [Bacteroidota bacterium]
MEKQQHDESQLAKLQSELEELDKIPLQVNGKEMLASQCYYLGTNPFHILYNTNCPDHLKYRIETIAAKYFPTLP